MRNFLLFSCLLFVPLFAQGSHRRPEQTLHNLIEVTEQALEAEKQLVVLVKEFEQVQGNVANGVGGNQEAARLVLLARRIDALIDKWSLHDYFTSDFIGDVSVLASMGRKSETASR